MELPKGRVTSSINVTPLVDVMLVLLIIFMVVTPMLGPMVSLPQTENPSKQSEDKDQVLVALRFEEGALIDIVQGSTKERIAGNELRPRLAEYRERNRAATLVIQADYRLDFGAVKKAMMEAREAGFDRVGLIAKPLATERKGVGRAAA